MERRPEVARDNARLLKARLETTTNAKGQAWSSVVQKWEVRAEGNVVLARLATIVTPGLALMSLCCSGTGTEGRTWPGRDAGSRNVLYFALSARRGLIR